LLTVIDRVSHICDIAAVGPPYITLQYGIKSG